MNYYQTLMYKYCVVFTVFHREILYLTVKYTVSVIYCEVKAIMNECYYKTI